MSDDKLQMDPQRLAVHLTALEYASRRFGDFSQDISSRIAAFDPTGGGDDTGKAIGAKYFDNARAVLGDLDRQVSFMTQLIQALRAGIADHALTETQNVAATLSLTAKDTPVMGDPKQGTPGRRV